MGVPKGMCPVQPAVIIGADFTNMCVPVSALLWLAHHSALRKLPKQQRATGTTDLRSPLAERP